MSLRVTRISVPEDIGRTLFLSASIPDPERWDGEFDALAITDAVVALARTFLSAGWRLVTAAHPTIAPLLLYVAGAPRYSWAAWTGFWTSTRASGSFSPAATILAGGARRRGTHARAAFITAGRLASRERRVPGRSAGAGHGFELRDQRSHLAVFPLRGGEVAPGPAPGSSPDSAPRISLSAAASSAPARAPLSSDPPSDSPITRRYPGLISAGSDRSQPNPPSRGLDSPPPESCRVSGNQPRN
jgi:hypothetical protein